MRLFFSKFLIFRPGCNSRLLYCEEWSEILTRQDPNERPFIPLGEWGWGWGAGAGGTGLRPYIRETVHSALNL